MEVEEHTSSIVKPEDQEIDLRNDDCVSKSREASQIAQQVLDGVLSQVAPGKRAVELCSFGDALIEKLVAPLYRSKKGLEKGLAFPTCVSVNNCVAHYSPFESEDKVVLKDGDAVKIDLGVHLDGFVAVVAHTVVVGASAEKPVTGAQADVMAAAHAAAEVAVRMVKAGAKNTEVTEAVKRVAEAFGVTPISGALSHQLKRFVIDGQKCIIMRDEPEAKVEEVEFKPHEAYALDLCFSSGEGKPKEAAEERVTVYKRSLETSYTLKMKGARALFGEVTRRFSVFPFSLRGLVPHVEKGETGARMGVLEPSQHGMLHPYPVMWEKEGVAVAQVKVTALMLSGGTLKATGKALPDYVRSDKKLPEDLAALVATDSHSSKKAKKAAKAAGKADGDVEMA